MKPLELEGILFFNLYHPLFAVGIKLPLVQFFNIPY